MLNHIKLALSLHLSGGIARKPCGIFYRLNLGCAGAGARQVRTWEDGSVRTCAWPVNSPMAKEWRFGGFLK